MTKEKQKGNPRFAFLFSGEYYNYYRWKVSFEIGKTNWKKNLVIVVFLDMIDLHVFFVLFFQLISDQLSGSTNIPFAVIIIIIIIVIITIVIIVSVLIGNNVFRVSCMHDLSR